jgi:hypothetical protein
MQIETNGMEQQMAAIATPERTNIENANDAADNAITSLASHTLERYHHTS